MNKIKELTEFQLGYLAGMIDGEGCLSLLTIKDKRPNKSIVYRTELTIANTNKEALEQIQTWVGAGYVKTSKRQDRKDIYLYYLTSQKKLLCLLKQLKDRLIIKRDKLNIATMFLESRTKGKKHRYTRTELALAMAFKSLTKPRL